MDQPKAKKRKTDIFPSKSKGQALLSSFFRTGDTGANLTECREQSLEKGSCDTGENANPECSATNPDQISSEPDDNVGLKKASSDDDKSHTVWTGDICRDIIKNCFDNTRSKKVHNVFTCNEHDCYEISKEEQTRIHPKKFNHSWLKKQNWWLCYVEGEGMFCIICRKHHAKNPQNHTETFALTPSIRFKVDAIKTHCNSEMHDAAQKNEMLQKASIFHQEITKKKEIKDTVLEQSFSTAYFLMKSLISNRQFVPFLQFIEKAFSVDSLRFFDHRSSGSQIEIFTLLGETVKAELLKKVKNASAYGILTDEVCDISVTENLITFIQFYDKGKNQVATQFLSCQNILSDFESANAEAISTLLLKEIEENDGLSLDCLTGFSSDGASVMLGKKSGVAARLKQVNPVLLNIHCICHRLALACTDSNESLSYIKNIETWLRQLWQFFENSPQRMAAYLKIQTSLKSIHLNKQAAKTVAKRLKKACRTRWLSLEASVKSVKDDFEALLQTLSKFEKSDATAAGLLKKIKTLKFIGAIYILNSILPLIGELSKKFQKGSLNFSAIIPSINMTKDNIKNIVDENTPINNLSQDIESYTNMCAEIKLNGKDANELRSLLKNYGTALIDNIDRRFGDCSEVLSAFSIFDPYEIPQNSTELKNYGSDQLNILSDHFFKDNQEKSERLKYQWHGLKYFIRDTIKPNIPETKMLTEENKTPTEWLLLQLLNRTVLKELYPELIYVVEVLVSLPISNAWPERGASTLKAIKTKARNRLSSAMVESLLHVSINGPEPCTEECKAIIKSAVQSWLQIKARRKVPKHTPGTVEVVNRKESDTPITLVEDAGVQTEPVMVVNEETFQSAVQVAVKTLNLEHYSDDEEEEDWQEEDCLFSKEFN